MSEKLISSASRPNSEPARVRSGRVRDNLEVSKETIKYFSGDKLKDKSYDLKLNLKEKGYNVSPEKQEQQERQEELHWSERGIEVDSKGNHIKDHLLGDLRLEFSPASRILAAIVGFFNWIINAIKGLFVTHEGASEHIIRLLENSKFDNVRESFFGKFDALQADARTLKSMYSILEFYATLPKDIQVDIKDQVMMMASYFKLDNLDFSPEGDAIQKIMTCIDDRTKELERFFKGEGGVFLNSWNAVAEGRELSDRDCENFVNHILSYQPHAPGLLAEELTVTLKVRDPNEWIIVDQIFVNNPESLLYAKPGTQVEYYENAFALLEKQLVVVSSEFNSQIRDKDYIAPLELPKTAEGAQISKEEAQFNAEYKNKLSELKDLERDLKKVYLQNMLTIAGKSALLVDTKKGFKGLLEESVEHPEQSAKSAMTGLVSASVEAIETELKLKAVSVLDVDGKTSEKMVIPKSIPKLRDIKSGSDQRKEYEKLTKGLQLELESYSRTYRRIRDYDNKSFAEMVQETKEIKKSLSGDKIPPNYSEKLKLAAETQIRYILRVYENGPKAVEKIRELKTEMVEIAELVTKYEHKLSKDDSEFGRLLKETVMSGIWRLIQSGTAAKSADKIDGIKEIRTKLDKIGAEFGLTDIFGVAAITKEVKEIGKCFEEFASKHSDIIYDLYEKPQQVSELKEKISEETGSTSLKEEQKNIKRNLSYYSNLEFKDKNIDSHEDYMLRKVSIFANETIDAIIETGSAPESNKMAALKDFSTTLLETADSTKEMESVDKELYEAARYDIRQAIMLEHMKDSGVEFDGGVIDFPYYRNLEFTKNDIKDKKDSLLRQAAMNADKEIKAELEKKLANHEKSRDGFIKAKLEDYIKANADKFDKYEVEDFSYYCDLEFTGTEDKDEQDGLLRQVAIEADKEIKAMIAKDKEAYENSRDNFIQARLEKCVKDNVDVFGKQENGIVQLGGEKRIPSTKLLLRTKENYLALSKELEKLKVRLESSFSKSVRKREYEQLKSGENGWYTLFIGNGEGYNYTLAIAGEDAGLFGYNLNVEKAIKHLEVCNEGLSHLGKVSSLFKKYEGKEDPISKRMTEISHQLSDALVSDAQNRNAGELEKTVETLKPALKQFVEYVSSIEKALGDLDKEIEPLVAESIAEVIYLHGLSAGKSVHAQTVEAGLKDILDDQINKGVLPLVKALSKMKLRKIDNPDIKAAVKSAIKEILPSKWDQSATTKFLEQINKVEGRLALLASNMDAIKELDSMVAEIDPEDKWLQGKAKGYIETLSKALAAGEKLDINQLSELFGPNYKKQAEEYKNICKDFRMMFLELPAVVSLYKPTVDRFIEDFAPFEQKISHLKQYMETIKQMNETKEVKTVIDKKVTLDIWQQTEPARVALTKWSKSNSEEYVDKAIDIIQNRLLVVESSYLENPDTAGYQEFKYAMDSIAYTLNHKDQKSVAKVLKKISKMVEPGTKKGWQLLTTESTWENIVDEFRDFRVTNQANETGPQYVGGYGTGMRT